MIKFIEGDLLKLASNFDVIGHCANCFCVMGSGIAPQIKEKYPEAYEVDLLTKKGDITKLGTISHTQNTTPIIVNIYGQFDYLRKPNVMNLDYSALKSGLSIMKNKFTGKRFGLPMLGSGLAGGDWEIILAIINYVFKDEDVTIVKFKPF